MKKGINHLYHVASKIKNGEERMGKEIDETAAASSYCEAGTTAYCEGKESFIFKS